MNKTKPIGDRLYRLNACTLAVKWSNRFTDPGIAWKKCHRPDWMVWLLTHTCGKKYRQLMLCCLEMVEWLTAKIGDYPPVLPKLRCYLNGQGGNLRHLQAEARALKINHPSSHTIAIHNLALLINTRQDNDQRAAMVSGLMQTILTSYLFEIDVEYLPSNRVICNRHLLKVIRTHYPQPPQLPSKKRKSKP